MSGHPYRTPGERPEPQAERRCLEDYVVAGLLFVLGLGGVALGMSTAHPGPETVLGVAFVVLAIRMTDS